MNSLNIDNGKYLIENLNNFVVSQKGATSFINCYSFLELMKLEYSTLQKIDHWHIDGIILVKIINFFKKEKIQRYSFDFTSIAGKVFKNSEISGKKVAIIGTTEDNLKKFIEFLNNEYKELNITYSRNGYFQSGSETKKVITKIRKLNPDIIIVGMGTPYQERFIVSLKEYGIKSKIYTCGGFMHQTAQKGKNYYPEFFDKLNIRWLYRIIDEPKLIYRYAFLYPISVFLIVFILLKKN